MDRPTIVEKLRQFQFSISNLSLNSCGTDVNNLLDQAADMLEADQEAREELEDMLKAEQAQRDYFGSKD